MRSQASSSRRFLSLLDPKRSVRQGLGLGLHADIAAVDVSVNPQAPVAIVVRPPTVCASAWAVIDIVLDAQHKSPVGVEGEAQVRCRLLEWSPSPTLEFQRLDQQHASPCRIQQRVV